jgi:membrane-associated phospholipid phosphatase
MKAQFWRIAPRVSVRDLFVTLILLGLWVMLIYNRDFWIKPHCMTSPENCRIEKLWAMDQPAVAQGVGNADGLSFTTQGLAAVVGVSVPTLWQLARVSLGQVSPVAGLIAAGADLLIVTESIALNGFASELTHWITQRPRPFVYQDPLHAKDAPNYTSFYSGHTSFAAVATLAALLAIAGRAAPMGLIWLMSTGAYTLTFLTGLYRVLAGRHFPTDVLVAGLAGAAAALFVAWRHRRRSLAAEPHTRIGDC